MAPGRATWSIIIVYSAIILEVFPQQPVPNFYSTQTIEVPKGHYVEMTFTLRSWILSPCLYDRYLEVRDGHNQSANILGIFCGNNITGLVRSSGPYMWLKFSPNRRYYDLHGNYSGKAMNETVANNLNQMQRTQLVLFNHSSFLWCPAEGGPAPYIVWRKNGIIVQNSTSIRYQLDITKEYTANYSCEVDRHDGVVYKEISVTVERCPVSCRCASFKEALLRIVCEGRNLQSVPKKVPTSTVTLYLSSNQLQHFPEGAFSSQTQLRILNLKGNQLKELPPTVFAKNSRLQALDLSNNRLQHLPEGVFSTNGYLTILTLANNMLHHLPAGVLNSNTYLHTLILDNNQLKSLPVGIFHSNTQLQLLAVSKNQLRKLSEGVFSKNTLLRELYLRYNHLQSLPEGVFSTNTVLKILYLNGNQLKELPSNVFSHNIELKKLYLYDNELERLPGGIFRNNTQLNELLV